MVFRDFSRRLFLAGLMSLLVGTSASAASLDDIKGMFEPVTPPVATKSSDKVEVVEVFWYRCPHCYRLQPTMIQYEKTKPDYVEFIRMPAVLSERWKPAAKAFYTAVALDALEKIHGPMFAAIHQERKPMQTDEEVKELFVSHGVDGAEFDKRWKSFGVDSQVRRATKKAADYGITGVPTIIINGRYRTGPRLTGSAEATLEVIQALVEAERERMGLK
jgi:thiol:disulfide interchange protein DsbA